MSIKLEEGKFYKTKNGRKVECLKTLPPDKHGYAHVCIVYAPDRWLSTNYQPDGKYYHSNTASGYDILSEWTKADELGLEPGQIVWVRNDECDHWRIGYFIGEKSGNKPYGVTSFINVNGNFASINPSYYGYIRATQPSNCLSKHGSLEANHD